MCNRLGRKHMLARGMISEGAIINTGLGKYIRSSVHRPDVSRNKERMIRMPTRPLTQSYLYRILNEFCFLRDKYTCKTIDRSWECKLKPSKVKHLAKLERYDDRARKGLSDLLARQGENDPIYKKHSRY